MLTIMIAVPQSYHNFKVFNIKIEKNEMLKIDFFMPFNK